ncbi:MAG TPA: ABC transporter ATP-binding protein [Armatimonadetes bacterium]|nr:ABC transporter ATP-binding protein [Armatimonadota bacterium]
MTQRAGGDHYGDVIVRVSGLEYAVDGRLILEDINFDVREGEIFGIMGMSGSGKSTTLRCLMGLIQPSAGTIEIDGEVITGQSEDDLNSARIKMGMCFQMAALFDSMTVHENVAFGLKRHTKLSKDEIAGRVAENLAIVGLTGFEDYMPADLSGGMRKRVGIARAMIMHPKILLYDEPTSGLDPITAGQINGLILRLRQEFGTTSIVVTHEVDRLFAIADRVMMIDERTVTACGTPEELFRSDNERVRAFVAGDMYGPTDMCLTGPQGPG